MTAIGLTLPVGDLAARRRRVAGVVMRDLYSLRRNPPRMVEVVFWPTVELVVWGYVSFYLRAHQLPAVVAGLLGAVLLWQALYRSQSDLSLNFLEDIWSRNLLNVFVSPLSTGEYLVGLIVTGIVKTAVGLAMMSVLAYALYGFGVLAIGPALVPFACLLVVMGWALGVVAIAAVVRFGHSAQTVAWILSFVFQPFAAVFYPLDVLPSGARAVAAAVPASYVFEGMRGVLAGGDVSPSDLAVAAVLDLGYVVAALCFLGYALRHARRTGRLSRFGD